MIKRILLIIILLGPILSYSQKTYVPDDIFEAWLEGNGYGDSIPYNDSVLTSSISTISQLDLNNKNISDLTGISDMLALQNLQASDNTISLVDLTGLYQLREINLQDNDLTQIVLPDSVAENGWGCSYPIEHEYWASYCGVEIRLYNNLLTSVIVPAGLNVSRLYLNDNPLDYLDIQGYGMGDISISNSNLTSVDLSNHNYLRYIQMYDNDSLLSFDVKNKIDLRSINTSDNDLLNNFDLRNINLININGHYFGNNPQLNCISVSDTLVANILLDQIDSWCSFSLNCTGLGCMDPNALNYDPNVVTDDGSCIYQSLTYVPDDNFESFLETLGWGDGIALNDSVVTSSLVFVTSLDVSGLSISDLTGIEAFNALKNLYCQNNNITSLNLSSNLNLEELYCQDNQIDSLDLNLNTNLDRLLCYTNGLTSLEINNCSSLGSIFCQNNQLTNLDVSQNTSLSYLEFVGNQISSIDLSNNINLVYLYANNNQLTSLDLSLNIALKRLECGDNQIVSLDLTNNTVLDHIYCPSNQLDFLDVKNGNNSNVSWFWANSNPNLTCINVDDTTYSNTNWTNIDPQSYFSNNCSPTPNPNLTYVPDDNFENYLEANGMGDGIALNDTVLTSNINTVNNLYLDSLSIYNLIGIQDFISLRILDASVNPIDSIDLSNNDSLTHINFISCSLASIDVSNHFYLQQLQLNYNQITYLDVTQNINLGHLDFRNNLISNIDLTQNINLYNLIASVNLLTSIDVSANVNLSTLFVAGNQLNILDLNTNTNIGDLRIGHNQFQSINLSNLTNLHTFDCRSNLFDSLDLSNNLLLDRLICFSNNITTLDLSIFPNLYMLWASSNSLVELDMRNGNNFNVVSSYFTINGNPNLTCVSVDDTSYANSTWTNIDSQSYFSNNCNIINGCTDPLASNYDSLATSDDGSCVYAATFNVDMNCEPVGSFGYVHLESPLFGWCGGCVPMTDPDGDGIHSVTVDLALGNFEYKYAVDGFAGQEDLVDDMLAGETCAPVTDYFSYANRLDSIIPGFTITDTYGSCSPCDTTIFYGCTDSLALNYDSLVTIDDGSCTYPNLSLNPVADTLCLGDTIQITWSGGNPADNIQLGTVNNTLWQTGFTIAIIPNTGSYTWVVSNFPPGPGDLYQFYIQDTPNQNSWDYGSVFAICPIYGCVDPLATNFNPQATLDDGSCLYINLSNQVSIDSINITNPISCYGNLADIGVYVDNDTSSLGTGPTYVTYQLKAFKVGPTSTFSYFSSTQTNASFVTANNLNASSYYLLVVDSIAFANAFPVQYFGSSAFLSSVLTDPSVYDYDSITIIEPTELVNLTSSQSSNLCYGDCNASELVSISGGVSPYFFMGNMLSSTDTLLQNLCAGPYNFIVEDGNGCASFLSFNINEPQISESFNTITTCDTLTWNGILYDSSGTYSYVSINPLGCDSTAYLYLSLNSCLGCTDPLACNYDSLATIDDGSCLTIYGCTDPLALNYDSLATCNDGSCIAFIYGCTDPNAINFYAGANTDDGSCIYNSLSLNSVADSLCLGDSVLISWSGGNPTDSIEIVVINSTLGYVYLNIGQTLNTGSFSWLVANLPAGPGDLFQFYISNYPNGTTWDYGSTFSVCSANGCTDSLALNYNPFATNDDGSCVYYSCLEPAPINLSATDVTDIRATVNWSNMNSTDCMVLKYNIRYKELGTNSWTTKSGGVGNGLCNFGVNTTSKILQNLTPGTTYQYKMKAHYCNGGASTWTLPKLFTTDDICPEMINLSAQTYVNNTGKVTFSWDSTGAYVFARVALRINNTGSSWQTAGGFGVYYPTLSVNKFGLLSGTDYRAQGRTFCDSNITSYRSWWTQPIFWTQPTIRLGNGTSISHLDVYPNPSRDVFNISFNSETVQNLSIRILNVVGAEIYRETQEQFVGEYTKQISLDDYVKGIYFLEIETGTGIINKKLILQ